MGDESPETKGFGLDDVKKMQEEEKARRQAKNDKRGKGRIWRRKDGGRVSWEEAEKEKKEFRRRHALPKRKLVPPGTSTAAPKPRAPGEGLE